MLIKSYSKINLSLRVTKKLKNKLHNIQTNTFLLNLHDSINIKKIKSRKDKVIFKGKFNRNINKKKNSVINTLKIIKKIRSLNANFQIIINKKIPVFAGLGGGTSNAIYLIKYFLGNKLDKKKIHIFEKEIGTDLRLFLYKQSFQKSLTNVINYKKNHRFYFLLLYPNIKCSTKEIYSRVKNYKPSQRFNFAKITKKNKLLSLLKKENNGLQNIVEKKHPIIKKIIKNISELKGCQIARMTGSGSVCFGLFKNKKSAIIALKKIKGKFPDYWSLVTKTI